MSGTQTYTNGLGATTGDSLATTKPLQMSGFAWFVNSSGGVDAASPAGRDRQKPLATIAQAHTNAAAGDIITCLSGHSETLTATQTISKQLTIVGEGTADPNLGTGVTFTINAAILNLFTITAAGVQLRNLRIAASAQSNTGGGTNGKINITTAFCKLRGLYIESSGNDQFAAVRLAAGADSCRIHNTTFISTATAVATRPTIGLQVAGAISDLELDGPVFSDGTVGYSSAAFDGSAAAVTRIWGENVSALLGADIILNAATTGWFNLATKTGGGRVQW